MSIDADVAALMQLADTYGEMREWHGARPGDDRDGQLGVAENALREALRMRLAAELATLTPAIAQLEAGDPVGALKMLLRRAAVLSTPVAK
jgi:hypothetical protein